MNLEDKMQKLAIPIALAALFGCAHEPPATLPIQETDWTHGLDAQREAAIAPVGPLESDQRAYDLIRRREQHRALTTKTTSLELDDIVNGSSQVLASALALPLFKAGVYYGAPRLIEKGCAAARRVTNSALRASGSVDLVLDGCSALTAGKSARAAGCNEGQKKLRDAYALLADDKGSDAGKLAAEAVQQLRDRCTKMTAPARSPVDPSSRGFLVLWVLHANGAPSQTMLAGEPIPQVAEGVNDAFVRGVEAVHAGAQASRN